jgi:ArsR family transcriptional regulator
MVAEVDKLASYYAEVYKVFSNPRRLRILWLLADHEMSVSEIAEKLDTSVQNTSQHLRIMKDKDILKSRREGHTIFYYVGDHDLVKNNLGTNNSPGVAIIQ